MILILHIENREHLLVGHTGSLENLKDTRLFLMLFGYSPPTDVKPLLLKTKLTYFIKLGEAGLVPN